MKVTITEVATGKTKAVDEDISYWAWTEGNWSCDCNRHIEFVGMYEESECGHSVRYTIEIQDER